MPRKPYQLRDRRDDGRDRVEEQLNVGGNLRGASEKSANAGGDEERNEGERDEAARRAMRRRSSEARGGIAIVAPQLRDDDCR